jgi:lipopolysaccharide/colanic/teichoic acid biosynthesis glycosyltransferase
MKITLLKTTNHTTRTYQHFRIKTGEAPAVHETVPTEFFYIGADKAKIDFLILTFGTGYAPETLLKGISLLKRLPSLRSKPALIIIDGLLGEQALKEVFSFLASNSYYENIPLILDASELDEVAVSGFRKLGLLDEIVFIKTEEPASLRKKIGFLRKIKKSATSRVILPEIPVDLQKKWVPRAVTKRIFDVVVSTFAITVLLPVFIVVAILVKLESRGPIFYISKRAGRGYKVFNFFKFRTMILDADKNLDELWHLNRYKSKFEGRTIFFKGDNDPRVTKLGLFLRRTSLDELPQLFNVLVGDMSLVGNRPLPLAEAASLTTDEWAARFLAPAGMTGLWQIRRKFQHDMTVEQRINLDIAYAHKYNFLYDLWIMANTPAALIQRSNS